MANCCGLEIILGKLTKPEDCRHLVILSRGQSEAAKLKEKGMGPMDAMLHGAAKTVS